MSDAHFDRAWGLVKAPLDLDSVRPVVLRPNRHGVGPQDFGAEHQDFKQEVGTFIHPKRGDKWPITMSDPSYSHDFVVEIGYPEGVEPTFDRNLGNVAAQANVHYADDDKATSEWFEAQDPIRQEYPPTSEKVSLSPGTAEHLRRAGFGTAMYDLVAALGYKIQQSKPISPDGKELWDSNNPHGTHWRGIEERSRDKL